MSMTLPVADTVTPVGVPIGRDSPQTGRFLLSEATSTSKLRRNARNWRDSAILKPEVTTRCNHPNCARDGASAFGGES
jgi:hypothetical protein